MRNSLVIASLGLVLTTGLHAQQTNVGNITGSVQDATAAIVPGAEVLVVNTATGVAQSASTTSAGLYNINLLPVGSYTVTVTKTGFQKETKINVAVLTGQTSTVDFVLRVGSTTQAVTVSAAPSAVNTTDTTQGTTRTLQELEDGGCGDVHPLVARQSAYLNKAAFSDPAPFTLGNTYVLPTVRQCGYFDKDLGVDKGFPFGENRRVSVGAYFTNLFNRHPFIGLNGNIDSPAFETFSNANFPRTVQLYMKVTF